MSFLHAALVAGSGAAFQELLHWYELREHLKEDAYRTLLQSTSYWVVTTLMILGSGVGTAGFYATAVTAPSALALLGAGFPLLFKRLVTTTVDQRAKLGGPAPTRARLGATPLRWYFLGRAAEPR